MDNKISILFAFFVLILIVVPDLYAQSSNPTETLKQYISDLQKNPNDNALREKIIKHVQTKWRTEKGTTSLSKN